jgi:hypothetical protein
VSTFLTSEVLADILCKTPKLKLLHISKVHMVSCFGASCAMFHS